MAKRTYSNVPYGASTPKDKVWIADRRDNDGRIVWVVMDRSEVLTENGHKKPTEWHAKNGNDAWEPVFNECFCNTRGDMVCSNRVLVNACSCKVYTPTNDCPSRTNAETDAYCNCFGRTNYCDCKGRSSGASCCCNHRGNSSGGHSGGYDAFSNRDGHTCACNNRTNTCLCMHGISQGSTKACEDNGYKGDACDGCKCKARTGASNVIKEVRDVQCTQNVCSCVSRGDFI